MATRTALIAGASGLIGRRIADRLLADGNWDIIGLARRPPPARPDIRWIAVDLHNADDCRSALGGLSAVTHVFYAARYDHPEGQPESVDINTAMMCNLIETLEPLAGLQHVHVVHGSKYYGHQLGPVTLPMQEDTSPRAPGSNYYFNQEDYLIEHSRGKAWGYSTTRPHAFCDPAVDHPRSIGLVIAVFAALQRELGAAFDFPGTAAGYEVHTQFTDLALLARAAVWMSGEPRCRNQAFNVVNGDNPRWSELWPRFASWFGMKNGVPLNVKLADYVRDKGPVWDALVKRHGLRETKLEQFVLWAYGDYQLRPQWNVVSSMAKARALGFQDAVDSHDMFIDEFEHFRAAKIIP